MPTPLRSNMVACMADANCMIMDAEIYGIMFSAKIVMRCKAPPENMLNIPRIPPC